MAYKFDWAALNPLNWFGYKDPVPQELRGKKTDDSPIDDRPMVKDTAMPAGRSSVSEQGSAQGIDALIEATENYGTVNMNFIRQLIPIIRGLAVVNPDISQAIYNVMSLGNTGHKIYFDKGVSPELQDKMRNHLLNKRKDWAPGQAGMDGVVNKMISQLLIGGAISNEWVPNSALSGIDFITFVNPESIYFKLNKATQKFEPYQRPRNYTGLNPIDGNLIKLNPKTYRYFALGGDGELPYGIPPYIPAVGRIPSQNKMLENIDFIVDTMGLIGFLEVLVDKPEQQEGETVEKYRNRLTTLLKESKTKVMGGIREGVVVGFKEDHEFEFHSAAKNYNGVTEIFQENELQVASGAKQDAQLWGRGYATSETQITVVFNKLLSELRNMHNLIKANLEFGYSLELRLAGFIFDSLEVKFNRSTLQDDYKYQQAEEIKIRNIVARYVFGAITHEQACEELGSETPANNGPLVPVEMLAGKGGSAAGDDAQDKKDRNKDKKTSDKKTRKDNKPLPKEK